MERISSRDYVLPPNMDFLTSEDQMTVQSLVVLWQKTLALFAALVAVIGLKILFRKDQLPGESSGAG